MWLQIRSRLPPSFNVGKLHLKFHVPFVILRVTFSIGSFRAMAPTQLQDSETTRMWLLLLTVEIAPAAATQSSDSHAGHESNSIQRYSKTPSPSAASNSIPTKTDRHATAKQIVFYGVEPLNLLQQGWCGFRHILARMLF